MQLSGQLHAPAVIFSGKVSYTHCTGYLGIRCLNAVARKISAISGNQSPVVHTRSLVITLIGLLLCNAVV
jgi:hypothetical protein